LSGICGVIGLDGRRFKAADIAGVRQALRPLGESEGCWDGTVGRSGVALGVTVSKWTPEDEFEDQPFWLPDESLGIISDLRIDNRPELIAQLGLSGASKLPDSALALAAYERLGEGFLERIVGSFAMAIVDRRRGGILLVRDHIGERPLVVHERFGVVAFASNALALTELEEVGHELDSRWATEILALAYDTQLTPVRGVRWLPRASAAWIDARGLREWRWWDPDPHEFDEIDPDEHEQRLRSSLEAAVSARLRSSGRVCTSLSGGLDSASVTATAARICHETELRTYTVAPRIGWDGPAPPGWDADESPLVADLADVQPNLDSVILRETSAAPIFSLQEPLWELGGVPQHNPCNALWIRTMIERAVGDGYQVQLGGDAGNGFFSADGPEWLAVLLRRGRILELSRESQSWARVRGQGLSVTLRRELLPHLLPPRIVACVRRSRGRSSRAESWISATAMRENMASDFDFASRLPMLEDRQRIDSRQVALDGLDVFAAQADSLAAMRAAWGLDYRDPTADRRVLEAAISQPEWVRRRQGVSRAVARAAMADRLPASIAQRTRRGAQFPDWLEQLSNEKSQVKRELDSATEDPLANQLIDIERLRTLVQHWPSVSRAGEVGVIRDYRHVLLRALLLSRYLRWLGNRLKRGSGAGRRRSGERERAVG
jgi:asparagine synthase (glutamine-hydrolysing)